MTDRTKLVLAGWANLSEAEREEFEREIRRYQQGAPLQKSNIQKNWINEAARVSLGPVGRFCPCCGK
ncbi:MAG: hypothetical protein HY268_20650 [Deltaproteobacteria bacterium]|nr:hypothetical protein [Deltaproteobacteria bacterium]